MAEKELKLEEKLKRIEEIVNVLDSGEAAVDEMLKLYEEAMGLSIECRNYLEKAEHKIVEISKKANPDSEIQ